MKKKLILIMFFCVLLICFLPFLNSNIKKTISALETENIEKKNYIILNRYQHNQNSFTQGLEIHEDKLYESNGVYGKSSLKAIDLNSYKTIKKIKVKDQYFAEGITILNHKIYQLSWKENTAFVYNLNFKLLKKFNYSGEGWGLANDGNNLIMSDGSEFIYYRNPENFEIIKKIKVKNANNNPITKINELEYHNKKIYANIWGEDYIIIINPQNGKVEAYLDFSQLKDELNQAKIDVLNGIAYNKNNNSFLITGKLWPKIFEIRILNNN